jgi:hypothetical protein
LSDVKDYNSEELESGGESDESDVDKNKYPVFKLPSKMCDYEWEVGTYFATKKEFQHAVRTYAVHSTYDIKFKKNDLVRMRVRCKPGCDWSLFCARVPNEETWQVCFIIVCFKLIVLYFH